MSTHDDLCRNAWQASKKDHQPDYDSLIEVYRNRLRAIAEATLAAGVISGQYIYADFERKVLESQQPTAAVKEELAAEAVSEAPQEEAHELKGHLPKDFPAHEKLHEAGINTYGQLAKTDDLTAIEGVGPRLAEKIHERLKADAAGK